MDFVFYLKIEISTPSENTSQKMTEISRHTTWEYSSTGKTHTFLPELFSFHACIISNCSDSCKIRSKNLWLSKCGWASPLIMLDRLGSSPLLLTWSSSLGIWTLVSEKNTLRLMYLKTLSAKACYAVCHVWVGLHFSIQRGIWNSFLARYKQHGN